MTGEVAYSDYPHTEVSVGTLSSADTGSVTVTQYNGNNEATITAVAPPDVDGERVTIKDRDYYDLIDAFGNSGWVEGYTHVLSGCGDERGDMIEEYEDKGVSWTPDCSDFTQSESSTHFSFSDLNSGTYSWAVIDNDLEDGVDDVYDDYGSIDINSGYRSPIKNNQVGGATNSRHVYGDAVDIDSDSSTWDDIAASAYSAAGGCIEPKADSGTGHVHSDWRPGSCPWPEP